MEAKILMLKGEKGDPGGSTWGNISGTLSSQTDLKTALDGKVAESDLGAAAFSNDYGDLDNTPALKTVATTGSYNDLTNKPTIPTINQILNAVYPVGSYYWSSNSANPGTFFGGTWEQVKDKFVLAAGDTYSAGDIGGEVTHTLTVSEIPSHDHQTGPSGYTVLGGFDGAVQTSGGSTRWSSIASLRTGFTGGGEAHNNMPPYVVAYCFKRIA